MPIIRPLHTPIMILIFALAQYSCKTRSYSSEIKLQEACVDKLKAAEDGNQ